MVKCVFCSEKEATKEIFDPNWFPKTDNEMPPINDPKRQWKVCADCFYHLGLGIHRCTHIAGAADGFAA